MKRIKKLSAQAIINIVAIVLIIALFLVLYFLFREEINALGTEEGLNNFVESIQNTGFWGAIILVFIQVLQVVVAFIPGEFVELASGMMFGPFLGLVLCLIGLNLGTLLIWGLVKWLGKPFVNENIDEKKNYFKFLEDPNRALIILFFIFLIPGIPKDVLIYPVPLTKVKLHKFLIVSSIARIPSIITSTITGASILDENYLLAGIVMVTTLVLSIIGLIFNKQITSFIETKFLKKEDNHK